MELIEEYLRKRIKTLTKSLGIESKETTRQRLLELQKALKAYKGETDEFIKLALTEKL